MNEIITKEVRAIMLDLETLATTPDACILSIGAVEFNPYSEEFLVRKQFYVTVDIAQGRTISQDTLWWWMQQGKEAQRVFNPEEARILEDALVDFARWIEEDTDFVHADKKVDEVWSNGADFDIPIILSAAAELDIVMPWSFRTHRCFRTLRALYPNVKAPAKPETSVSHNALDDAINQARWCHLIMRSRESFSSESSVAPTGQS